MSAILIVPGPLQLSIDTAAQHAVVSAQSCTAVLTQLQLLELFTAATLRFDVVVRDRAITVTKRKAGRQYLNLTYQTPEASWTALYNGQELAQQLSVALELLLTKAEERI